MDLVDFDHIVDVPDTPDRLTRQGITGKTAIENENCHSPSTPRCLRQPNIFKGGTRDQPMIIDSGSKGPPKKHTSISSNPRLAINSTASSFSSSSNSRNAHLFREGVTDTNPSYLSHEAIQNHHPRSVRPSCISKSSFHGDSFVDLTGKNMHKPVIGNVSGIGTEFVGSDIQEKHGNGGFVSRDSIASPGINKQKRLVRNGCISPNNVAKTKQLAGKEDSSGSVDVVHKNSGSKPFSAPLPIDIMELVADEKTRKGKGVITNPCSSKEPDSRNKNLQSRNSISYDESVIGLGNYDKCAGKSIVDSGGWRSTRIRNSEMNISSPDEELRVIRARAPSRHSSQHHENRFGRSENGVRVATGDDKGLKLFSSERIYPQPSKESVSHHVNRLGRLNGTNSTANTLIKRQKQGSTSSTYGQCSTSVSDDPEVISLGSPASNSRSTFRHVVNLDQITEVDEFSPPARHSAEDEDAKARQVEADECLARELQEQFYNELPGFGSEEVDEHVALALQHQDGSSNGYPRAGIPIFDASASRSRQSQSRSSSAPRRGSLARSVSHGRLTRLRNRFPGQARTLLSSSGGASLFPEGMDVEMRMHILGALEEFNDMGLSATAGILHAPRDFNENDYEMLLALDDNNDRHSGASVRQINGLPQSIVQTENFEETCAVCLEIPTIGETIRHLPCMHKFHKNCIDPWLRRRTSCPVCKSSVT